MAKRTCEIDGCGKPHEARGLCKTHYNRQLEPVSWCSLDGCGDPVHARGWCRRHYESWRRRGDPLLARQQAPASETLCGTNAMYCRGCRCDGCVTAAREYQRAWRAANLEQWSELRRRHNRKYRATKRGAFSKLYSTSQVLERDGWRCQICGKRIGKTYSHPHPRSASIDHIVPLSVGGDDTLANVQAAHLVCNVGKGNRALGEQLRLVG